MDIETGQFWVPPLVIGVAAGVLTWNTRIGATVMVLAFFVWNWFLLTR